MTQTVDEQNANLVFGLTVDPLVNVISGLIADGKAPSITLKLFKSGLTGPAVDVGIQFKKYENGEVTGYEAIRDFGANTIAGLSVASVVSSSMLLAAATVGAPISAGVVLVAGVSAGIYVALDSAINDNGPVNTVKSSAKFAIDKTAEVLGGGVSTQEIKITDVSNGSNMTIPPSTSIELPNGTVFHYGGERFGFHDPSILQSTAEDFNTDLNGILSQSENAYLDSERKITNDNGEEGFLLKNGDSIKIPQDFDTENTYSLKYASYDPDADNPAYPSNNAQVMFSTVEITQKQAGVGDVATAIDRIPGSVDRPSLVEYTDAQGVTTTYSGFSDTIGNFFKETIGSGVEIITDGLDFNRWARFHRAHI